ncbi:DUF4238 domain-containing protein [Kribbella sp. NPDC051620]|uniref:DUF4238 domain-containing protein n=1 Tax=Kribbella sp. NPDC051620 TaxID=3364120 RepID=UPI0037BB15C7
MVDPFSEMHHLVSKAYQWNFATEDRRVAVIDARTGKIIDRRRAVKHNFARAGYSAVVDRDGVADSRLEREFSKIETPILHQIRQVTAGGRGREQRAAVINLFALHLVRSEAFEAKHGRIVEDLRREWLPDLASNQELREQYAAELGVDSTDEDIIELGERILTENVRSNRMHVDGMVRMHNKIADQLAKFHVQVITSERLGMGFALGDIPVVHANTKQGRYGFRDDLAIGDADLIIGPLTRTTAAALTVRPVDSAKLAVKKRMQEINAVFARAALNEVACHPDDVADVRRVCEQQDRFSTKWLAGG